MTDTTRYLIPVHPVEFITEIKRSRFIAHIAHASNSNHAFSIIEQAKIRYPDARHHCWAFIACSPKSASTVRFSDAGEPSGTAGRPILNVLQHSQYGEIICVVSRYFGGTKLGAGGLVRAYSNSTRAALEKLTVKEKINLTVITIQFPYPFESAIRHYLEAIHVAISKVSYHEQVVFQLQIEKNQINSMLQFTRNLCKGDIELINSDPNKNLEKFP